VDNAKWTPAVIVNGLGIPVSYQSPQLIKQCFPICYIAGFFQDADNYYIRINMHFSTNAVKIEFVPPQFSNGQAAAVVLGQPDAVSNQFYVCPACLATTHGVAFDSSGNLWVADAASNRVVRFSPPFTNDMSTNLVIGQPNSTVSTPSTSQAGLRAPYGVAFDSSGDLWVSDAGNNRVLEFKPPFSTGMAASLVIGQSNFTGEAYSNTATGFWAPTALAFDSSGNLWVADFVNSRVLEFSAPFSSGMAASLVLGQADYTSDVFGTTQNAFWAPSGLAFDNAGSLWVSDSGNNRVLEFIAPFTTGMNASLVLGQSSFTASTSTCAATQSAVCSPMGVSFDEWGNLWATDTQNNRVLEFSPPFSTGMNATSVLGQPDFKSGSPSTTAAGLSLYLNAIGLTAPAFDKSGNLWIGDTSNNRVVELIARSNAISTVSTTSTISTVSTLSTLSTSATSSTISTAPEFPQILGTSAVLLTWVVVLAVVGRVLFTYQKHRSNGPP